MAKQMDLEDKKPHGPLQGVKPRVVPGLGKMPFKAGEVIIGPEEGKASEGLVQLVRKTLDEEREKLKEQPKGKPAGSRPEKIVDIDELPPEKQQELREFAAKAGRAQLSAAELEKLIRPGMNPSVADAIRQAGGGETQGRPRFEAESVMDQLREKVAAKAPPSQDEEEPAPAEPKHEHASGQCPRCKWDLGSEKPPEPSSDDMAVFLAAILGDNRFVKSYKLFGGKLGVAFRSLTTQQGDLVLKQLAQDSQRGLVADRADFMRLFWDYRLCLSLLWYEVDTDRTDAAEAVDQYLEGMFGDGDATPLPTLLQRMQRCAPLNEETVWRLVSQTYRNRFQALLDGLEYKANDPSFSDAIEG